MKGWVLLKIIRTDIEKHVSFLPGTLMVCYVHVESAFAIRRYVLVFFPILYFGHITHKLHAAYFPIDAWLEFEMLISVLLARARSVRERHVSELVADCLHILRVRSQLANVERITQLCGRLLK